MFSAFDGTPLAALQFVNRCAAREARRYGMDAGDVANEMLARLHATEAGQALFLSAANADETGIHARAHISRRMHGMVREIRRAEMHHNGGETADAEVTDAMVIDVRSTEAHAVSRAFWSAFASCDLAALPAAETAGGKRVLHAPQDAVKAAIIDNCRFTTEARRGNACWTFNVVGACEQIGARSDRRTREAMLAMAQQLMFAVQESVAGVWGVAV